MVVEKSQILIQIVDGRNPLFFRSPDLEYYIKDVSADKDVVLLVNKADLLTPEIRRHWADYFKENSIKYIFFSALIEADKIELEVEKDLISQIKKDEKEIIEEEEEKDLKNQFTSLEVEEENKQIKEENKLEEIKNEEILSEEKVESDIALDSETKQETLKVLTVEELEKLHEFNEEIKVYNRGELIEFINKISRTKNKNTMTDCYFIGFIGYPNVGKSSVINVLMKKKRVNINFNLLNL